MKRLKNEQEERKEGSKEVRVLECGKFGSLEVRK